MGFKKELSELLEARNTLRQKGSLSDLRIMTEIDADKYLESERNTMQRFSELCAVLQRIQLVRDILLKQYDDVLACQADAADPPESHAFSTQTNLPPQGTSFSSCAAEAEHEWQQHDIVDP